MKKINESIDSQHKAQINNNSYGLIVKHKNYVMGSLVNSKYMLTIQFYSELQLYQQYNINIKLCKDVPN